MSTQEYHIPHSSEEQMESPHFRVRSDSPKRLYRAIRRNYSGEIGETFLQEVSKKATVRVECSSYYDKFSVSGNISKIPSLTNEPQQPFETVLASLQTTYGEIIEQGETGNKSYIVKGQNGTYIQLSKDEQSLSFKLLHGRDDPQDKYSIKNLKQESLDGLIEDFTGVFQTAIESIYHSANTELPKNDFILSVPKFEQQIDPLKYRIPEELKGKIDLEVPDVSFEDIGGQEKAKRELRKITIALDHPNLYKEHGTHPPKGVLLFGPPGTGKTLLAKALASESDAFFMYVSLSEVTSKWYGDTEKTVVKIFDWAAAVGKEKPTILFFDEIDSIAIKREDAHEATQRALSVFLTSMSGFKAGGNVIVVGATNRIESIDPALLRPDRFDRKIYVGLPDETGIEQIFKIKKRQAEELAGKRLFADIDLGTIVPKMEGFSGADIGEIVRRALEEEVVSIVDGKNPGLLTTINIIRELDNYEKDPQKT